MSSQGAEVASQEENLPYGTMGTFVPHLLVQLVALLVASGGLILLAFSEWSGLLFALLFLLLQVCLHFFIKSTNSYVQAFPASPLRIVVQVLQSAFVVMGIAALGIVFWWLFEWCLFKVYNEGKGSDFYFDLHGVLLSLVPGLIWIGLIGEAIRQLFPVLKQGKGQFAKYFTTWE